MRFALASSGPDGHHQGFTLVSVLVALGIIAVAATLYMNVANQSRLIKKRSEASMTTQDIEEMLKADMVEAARKYFKAGCKGAPAFSRSVGAAGTEVITRTINLPAFAPQNHAAAAGRCASSPYLRANGNGNALYLCVAIKRGQVSSAAIEASLLDTEYAFAEFFIRPQLPQNGAPVSCAAIASHTQPPNTAMEGAYAIYWSVRNLNDHMAKQHVSYFVARVD